MKKLIVFLSSAIFSLTSAWAQININTATQAEWETLNGIGPSKAKAIVDYRTQVGGFKSVDEITNVRGIGPKTLESIRPELGLGAGTVTKALPASANKVISSSSTRAIPATKPARPIAP